MPLKGNFRALPVCMRLVENDPATMVASIMITLTGACWAGFGGYKY